jgi:hypothetical protein
VTFEAEFLAKLEAIEQGYRPTMTDADAEDYAEKLRVVVQEWKEKLGLNRVIVLLKERRIKKLQLS